MSLVAPVVDGKLQTSTTSSDSLSAKKNNNVVSSDTFLTLLVAEMQNQDPLQPTSNTEWVSQYATFTQVEQIGEMAESMNTLRANSLVGKEVIMKVTSQSTGETSYKRGVVDYVVMEEGKALLNIDGANYSMDDLDTVASAEYFDAYDFYTEFTAKMDALPNLNAIDKSYETTIGNLFEMYDGMTDSQKTYMENYAPTYLALYQKYIDRMADLGISYKSSQKTEITMNDLLEQFNKRMDDILQALSSVQSGSSSANASQSGGSANTAASEKTEQTATGEKTEETSEKTEEAQTGTQETSQEQTQEEENEESSEVSEEVLNQLTEDM